MNTICGHNLHVHNISQVNTFGVLDTNHDGLFNINLTKVKGRSLDKPSGHESCTLTVRQIKGLNR